MHQAPDSTETRTLLQKAAAGDQRAFEQLFSRHSPGLRRFVHLRLNPELRSRLDPADVVQETHLEAFRRLPNYLKRRPMPFRVWLRRTAYQRILMARRQHLEAGRRAVGREIALPDRSSHLLARRLVSAAPPPSQSIHRRELVERVRQALAQLPDADREMLLMRDFEELSYQDVAFILGIDAAAARKRYGRALLRLHKVLSDNGMTGSEL